MTTITLNTHQKETVDFYCKNPSVLNMSAPGTQKTISTLAGYKAHRDKQKVKKRMLVFAPLSILQASWGNDCEKAVPELSYAIATSSNRLKAFQSGADIVITNHDAIKWVQQQVIENPEFLDDFDTLVIDEFTAYKNQSAQRTKAAIALRHFFDNRWLLSGTPIPNGVLDIWAPAFICDDGQRLGDKFYAFRSMTCDPRPMGKINLWQDKPGIQDEIGLLLKDITIRYALNECADIPDNVKRYIYTDLTPQVRKAYNELLRKSALELENGEIITAVHAGARADKLLQLTTGALYNEDGEVRVVHLERYKIVIDLILEGEKSLVAFNYKHERDQLVKLARTAKLKFAVIDGDTPVKNRPMIVDSFQKGELDAVFAHPQSAGHGLTLTRGTRTIWCSPNANAEYFEQFNARIHRASQTQKTETIMIVANDTREKVVYEMLQGKIKKQTTLLDLMVKLQNAT